MIGAFVQVNTESIHRHRKPVGYVLDGNGCWLWTGARTRAGGYGQLRVKTGLVLAHRWMYEQVRGPIPQGLTIDHLCRNRTCVNPDHLEPVTIRENILRGAGRCANNARKTHCQAGHPLSGSNLRNGPRRGRECVTCSRAYQRDYQRRYRAAQKVKP